VVTTPLELAVIYIVWRWGLPRLGIELPFYLLVIVLLAWLFYSVITFVIVTRALAKKADGGLTTMLGRRGEVARALAPEGLVRINGELWAATSVAGDVACGEEVVVVGQEGLRLAVRPDVASTVSGEGN